MSSIMDELKTLQSERTGPGTLDPAETGDDGPPSGGGPVLRTPGRGRRRPPGLVLGVGIVLGALAAALVLPGRGAKTPPSDDSRIARADEEPSQAPASAEDSVAPASGEATADEAEPEAGGNRALASSEAEESAETETTESAETDAVELAPAKPGDADGAVAAEAAGGMDETPEQPPDERTPLAAVDEATESPDEPGPEAVEASASEPAEEAPPPPPLRVLTKAEDEANKAAIRSLKVFGVLVDQKGVGVYTSEGELRAGTRFNDMEVTEVTSRYVVFESGNKRYRWLLPGRRSAKAAGGAR